jgi:hypothetical protein
MAPFGQGTWSVPLGSCLFGIPIRLHITFIVLLIVQVCSVIPGASAA